LSLNVPLSGTTIGATDNYRLGANSCLAGITELSGLGPDVVYSFVAPATANYSFRVLNYNSSIGDLLVYVLTNCPNTLGTNVLLGCVTGANGNRPAPRRKPFAFPSSRARPFTWSSMTTNVPWAAASSSRSRGA
jgi:hypothetical protein